MSDSIGDAFERAVAEHYRPEEAVGGPSMTNNVFSGKKVLMGAEATTHQALVAASRKVEEANRILTDAQQEFRTALAAHLKAITGSEVKP